ncbi:hypothetical protein [Thermotoga sp. KOL6]|uniref:hypothetical protein n=1 Tax=Thermotoga sp. KOL6 TaxID=126741 RepID=UPI000CC4D859|nr:hypothetical protein [Thermotoga sp. KOL6]PLV59745.1 hypothetical protein AS005_00130 [Thermotoga sp. KOL6]
MEGIQHLRYKLGIAALLVSLTILLNAAKILEIARINLGVNPMRGTINEGVITLVDSLKGTIVAVNVKTKKIIARFSGFSYPVWGMYVDGNWYITDMFEGKFLELSFSGQAKRWIVLGGDPTVFIYHQGVFYVSLFSQGTLIGIDKQSFRIVERYRTGISSTYFTPTSKGIAYLCYWKNEGEPDVYYLHYGSMNPIYLGLSRPLRYLEGASGDYVLDYKNGWLVKLVKGKIVWKRNLPDFAYDLSFYGTDIAIGSLVSPVISVVDKNGNVRKIDVPHPVLCLEEFGAYLVALSVEAEEIYLIKDDEVVETRKTGKYPLKIFKISENELAILCSDSGELVFYKIF